MNKNVLLAIIVILAGAVGYLGWSKFYPTITIAPSDEPVACTAEAKQCPDGSYVGRTGPKCEFAACPVVETTSTPPVIIEGTESWNTTTTESLSFRYPDKLPTTFMTVVDWPPIVTISTSTYSCIEEGSEMVPSEKTARRVVDGREYCRTTEGKGAAGSIYLSYRYITKIEHETVELQFSVREVQCANYDDPQKTKCIVERETFDIDPLVDMMARTVILR